MRRHERSARRWSQPHHFQLDRSKRPSLLHEPKVPLRTPIDDDPSPEGSDDLARILSIVAFNGVCRVISALARSGICETIEIEGMHEAMTEPLDNPEMRDDEVIAVVRSLLEEVLASAIAELRAPDVRIR